MSRRVVTLSQLTQLLWGEHGESERETFKKAGQLSDRNRTSQHGHSTHPYILCLAIGVLVTVLQVLGMPMHEVLGPELMRRLGLGLLLSSLAITGAVAGADLSHCLDPATKLDAGGDVSDNELSAARQACAQLQQSNLDSATRLRVDHAASTLTDERQHRQASHR